MWVRIDLYYWGHRVKVFFDPLAEAGIRARIRAPEGEMDEQGRPQVEMIGVGAALVDLLLHVEEDFLHHHVDGDKGGMVMVDHDHIDELCNRSGLDPHRLPGGAAANTTVGCAALGIASAFIGAAGADDHGQHFADEMRRIGCDPRLVHLDGHPTGRVLSMVTPDAERTMRTHLGAAGQLHPDHFTDDVFAGARLVMVEGYTLFNHDLMRAIAAAADGSGARIALDLASFEVVEANREVIRELLDGPVDLVFANEEEARAWHEEGIEAAWEDLAARCSVAVVKVGADGAWIAGPGGERHRIPAKPAEALDTTGAGDNWAAAFLAGWLRGLPLQACGEMGAIAGAAVVAVNGAHAPPETWNRIRGYLDAWT